MPLPLLLLAIPWLIAAVEALAQWAIRAALVYAAEYAWEKAKPQLMAFCQEHMPAVIIWSINKAFGVQVPEPLGPSSITFVINAKLAEAGIDLVLLDVTDGDQIKTDIREWGIARLCKAVPGIIFKPEYFANNASAKEKLRKCIYGGVKREMVAVFEGGAGNWMTREQGRALVKEVQDQYDYERPVALDDPYHEVSRTMAKWYRRHLRKHWVTR